MRHHALPGILLVVDMGLAVGPSGVIGQAVVASHLRAGDAQIVADLLGDENEPVLEDLQVAIGIGSQALPGEHDPVVDTGVPDVDGRARIHQIAKNFDAEILDDSDVSFTLQLTGLPEVIDRFVVAVGEAGRLAAVARSGSVSVSKGEVTLSSYARHHRLTG